MYYCLTKKREEKNSRFLDFKISLNRLRRLEEIIKVVKPLSNLPDRYSYS